MFKDAWGIDWWVGICFAIGGYWVWHFVAKFW